MKNIHLVRHAHSMGNAGFATDHPKTIILTELGQQQAEDMAAKRSSSVDMIIHSTYDRTYQTAKPLIDKYPFAQVVENELIHEFTYLDTVKYKGTNIEQRAPYKNIFWQQQDLAYKDSDTSESIIDLFTRVEQTIALLKTLLGKEVVVFSHSLFMRILLEVLNDPYILNRPDAKKYIYGFFTDQSKNIANTEIYTITDLLSR